MGNIPSPGDYFRGLNRKIGKMEMGLEHDFKLYIKFFKKMIIFYLKKNQQNKIPKEMIFPKLLKNTCHLIL